MMKFTMHEKEDEKRFLLTIPDFLVLELNEWDKLLLRDCDTSYLISDKLLALETIVRHIEKMKEKRWKLENFQGRLMEEGEN